MGTGCACEILTFVLQYFFPTSTMRSPVEAPSTALVELGHPNLWTLGVNISAILYGGLLFLTLSYVPLLLKTSYDISRRMRNFLLVYVTIMVLISTTVIVTTIIGLMDNIEIIALGNDEIYVPPYPVQTTGTLASFQNGRLEILCTMLASWGADGFMLWRCAMLYQGVSRPRRIALIAVLTFMTLVSFGSCLAFYITNFEESISFLVITTATVFLNLGTATLIALRVLYFDRYIRKTVGLERNGPYMTIISICVESSALIVVFSLIYMILVLTNYATILIPMHALVHVYVISPLLIVYRVAQGKAATIRQRPSESGPPVSLLCFAPAQPPSSSNHNEHVD